MAEVTPNEGGQNGRLFFSLEYEFVWNIDDLKCLNVNGCI